MILCKDHFRVFAGSFYLLDCYVSLDLSFHESLMSLPTGRIEERLFRNLRGKDV